MMPPLFPVKSEPEINYATTTDHGQMSKVFGDFKLLRRCKYGFIFSEHSCNVLL
jgi:hypothetical protein